ncbi:MAG TPA: DNA-directed RNA polymerase subunit N [Methanocella sp.]|uniref:DNA-directed RNA polymerase subunit N n=1 Tax=Methanocella sp. TaxID=2052833 RepID=UPI002BFE4CD7|nr:DNA-directed RNA polymerase subunit N [Methanocella sp.]HTY89552.1 DNA-directed RNA polymerase subunit N [Methanocella sp.]
MIPVRCFTCGKVVSNVWEEYIERVEERKKSLPRGEQLKVGDILDDLGIERYCCRRMLLSHVELVDVLAPYQ